MNILNIEMRNSSAELVFLLTKHDLPTYSKVRLGDNRPPIWEESRTLIFFVLGRFWKCCVAGTRDL